MDKKEVIKITLGLIKDKKLEKASVGKILKNLEASPGSLYYHFKNKSEIYGEVLYYSIYEITKHLDRVKLERNEKDYLHNLTKMLIKTLEKKEEILFFLIGIKGSCYLNEEVKIPNFLMNFKKVLLGKQAYTKDENLLNLKLNMFLGAIYEVLYINKLKNGRNLNKEEIKQIYESFWGKE